MRKTLLQTIGGMILIVIIWQALALLLNKNMIIPAPDKTFLILMKNLVSPEILNAALQTAWKVFLSLSLAILVGFPSGFFLGRSDTLYGLCRPIIMVIQAVPVISWLSLVIFVWGIGWKGPVFIAFLSLLPVAVLTTVSGIRNLDRELLEMAELYQVPRGKVFKNIYLGSLIPFIASILDVSIGLAWKVTLVTEYLCGGSGLGVKILVARMNVDIPDVWALTLTAILFGIITERLTKLGIRKVVRTWAPT